MGLSTAADDTQIIRFVFGPKKFSMYSSEYSSGFSGPAASHLAAPRSPRYEGNAEQASGTCCTRSSLLCSFASDCSWTDDGGNQKNKRAGSGRRCS